MALPHPSSRPANPTPLAQPHRSPLRAGKKPSAPASSLLDSVAPVRLPWLSTGDTTTSGRRGGRGGHGRWESGRPEKRRRIGPSGFKRSKRFVKDQLCTSWGDSDITPKAPRRGVNRRTVKALSTKKTHHKNKTSAPRCPKSLLSLLSLWFFVPFSALAPLLHLGAPGQPAPHSGVARRGCHACLVAPWNPSKKQRIAPKIAPSGRTKRPRRTWKNPPNHLKVEILPSQNWPSKGLRLPP